MTPQTGSRNQIFIYFFSHFILSGVTAGKRYLKKGSIPSQNLPLRPLDKRISPPQRRLQEARSARLERRLSSVIEAVPPVSVETCEVVCEVAENMEDEMFSAFSEDPLIRKCVEDKGIQVTPTILDECRKKTLEDLIKTNTDMNAFTGGLLDRICDAAQILERETAKPLTLSLRQRIILVFVKLKINISFLCLAVLFGVTANTCKIYFHVTVEVLHEVLRTAVPWLEKEVILKRCFSNFRDTRIVLDCTEIGVEETKCLKCRLMTYSHYKGDHTLKILVGVAPSGLITFLSSVYGGRVSDKEIFLQSGILSKMIPSQDAVMVDKGFLIEKECMESNIKLIRPPFLGKNRQLTAEDALWTAEIASARVHVERTIQRMKIFKILKGRLGMNMVPYMNCYMNSWFNIIAGAVNLSAPILNIDKFESQ